MYCSKCGFELKDNANLCPKCGSENIKERLIYNEIISTLDTKDISKKIKSKQTKTRSPIKIGFLIVLVLLIVGYGSYYIAFSKLSSDNAKKLKETSAKNNDTSNNSITPNKNPKISSDTPATKNNTDTNKMDSPDYYFFPKSRSEKLLDSDVSILSKQNLALARNEIYARHGYVFQTEPFKSYFKKKSWYKPDNNYKISNEQLNDVERNNMSLILKYENNQ